MINKNKKGFTLLEIMLTITAIGILSAIALVALNPNKQLEAGRSVKRRADMDAIAKAIEQYVVNNRGQYPPALQSVVTGGTVGLCATSPCVGGIDLTTDLNPYIVAIPLPDIGQYTITKTATGIIPGYDASTIWKTAGNTAPIVDFNFARDKQLVNAVNGSNPITFTRAETAPTANSATYIGLDGFMKTAGINEPRFTHDPITKSSLGLLIEEQRENLLTQSNTLSGWSMDAFATRQLNVIKDPFGNNTGTTITTTAGTSTSLHNTFTPINWVAGTYSFQVRLKYISNRWITIRIGGNSQDFWQSFDIQNAVKGATAGTAPGTSTIARDVDGWVLVTMTVTVVAPGSRNIVIAPNNSNVATFETWNPVSPTVTGLANAQLELGAFPTSYIPTAGSPVIRYADNANITGSNFTSLGVSSTVGTLFSQGLFPYAYNNGNPSVYSSIDNGTSANEILVRSNNSHTNVAFNSTINGTALTNINNMTGTSLGAGQLGRIAIGYSTGNSRGSGNGVLTSLDTTAFSSGTFNIMRIGRNYVTSPSTGYINGTISRLIYWNTRLSDTILTSITR